MSAPVSAAEQQPQVVCPTCSLPLRPASVSTVAELCKGCSTLVMFQDVLTKLPCEPPRVATDIDVLAIADWAPGVLANIAAQLHRRNQWTGGTLLPAARAAVATGNLRDLRAALSGDAVQTFFLPAVLASAAPLVAPPIADTQFLRLPGEPAEPGGRSPGKPETLLNLAAIKQAKWLPEHQGGELQICLDRETHYVRGDAARAIWALLGRLVVGTCDPCGPGSKDHV